MNRDYDPTAAATDRPSGDEPGGEFLQQFGAAYRDIYAAVVAIVGNTADADDVMQEVCLVLWRRFDQFEPGTSFVRWARAVVHNVARSHYRKKRRHAAAGLSDEALYEIARCQAGASEVLEMRREQLEACLAKLPRADRDFVWRCYAEGARPIDVARADDTAPTTVYSRLTKLRDRLAACIDRGLGLGGRHAR